MTINNNVICYICFFYIINVICVIFILLISLVFYWLVCVFTDPDNQSAKTNKQYYESVLDQKENFSAERGVIKNERIVDEMKRDLLMVYEGLCRGEEILVSIF